MTADALTTNERDAGGYTVAVVGAGGNIGSHLVEHLARTPGVRGITLVDRDIYDETNVLTQDIGRSDVGSPKATVLASRLRAIDPTLAITAITAAVEDVPLGVLRSDVLLACVDSRAARRTINARAWRLGLPWIDAGVRGDGLLARVNVYVPGSDQPCLECAWEDSDYAAIEQTYPCAGKDTPPATNAPSALGALAAALQALECRKLLAGAWEHVAVGRRFTVSALGHRALVTAFRPNPRCRFDHQVWHVDPLACRVEECTLAHILEIGRYAIPSDAVVGLKVIDQVFVRKLTCPACRAYRDLTPYLLGRLGQPGRTCERCAGAMRAAGSDVLEWLRPPELPPAVLTSSLHDLGLRAGDVVSVSDGHCTAHFELGGSV